MKMGKRFPPRGFSGLFSYDMDMIGNFLREMIRKRRGI